MRPRPNWRFTTRSSPSAPTSWHSSLPVSLTAVRWPITSSRELPVAARYCAHTLAASLPRTQTLELQRDEAGYFTFKLTQAEAAAR